MKTVVRTSLPSRAHSPANRSKAQELAWRWVGAKWPRLLPSEAQRALPSFERALPGQELLAHTSTNLDGSASVWSLSVAHTQRASLPNPRGGTRTWMTRVQVIDSGAADILSLQTACTEVPEAPLVVAPPRLLSDWVEGLDLQDAGLKVQGAPREVIDHWQLDALCEHLFSPERTLPIIALVNRPQTHYYGVDPQGLSENLSGLAHVVCIAEHLAPDIESRLGSEFVVAQGAARIYTAGFNTNDDRRTHPLLRDASPRGAERQADPGAFRRLLRRKICALSVETGGSRAQSTQASR